MSQSLPAQVDLLIVGGGPVGGALALALQQSGLSILLAEARATPPADPRALALSHASCSALAKLGLASQTAGCAIDKVHVSQQGGFGRVALSKDDLQLPQLGRVLPYGWLAQGIHQALQQAGQQQANLHYACNTRVSKLSQLAEYAAVTLQQGERSELVTARMVVLAEGGQLLHEAGIAQHSRDYAQHAVVAEVVSDRPHQHWAFERFAHDGPIALLPLAEDHGQRFAVVWTRPSDDVLAVAQLDDAQFLSELQQRIGHRAGRLLQVGPRASFPLRLKWAAQPVARRVVVVGNAAQTLHPVAGQGFNLGLRDALTLARLIRSTPRTQLGEPAMLARYAELRSRDSLATIGVTDGLIRLFAADAPGLASARGFGMLLMDNLKPLRRGFAQRMVFGV